MSQSPRKPLRVAFFNYSDISSGAEALINQTVAGLIKRGLEARLYVMDHMTDAPHVYPLPRFFGERRLEYMFRRATARNNVLFPSTLALGRRPWIKEADIWHFHNLHGHFVSIPWLATASRNRPIILSPVDQFLSTGYCPYTLGCERYRDACGQCPQLDLPYPGLSFDSTPALLRMKKRAVAHSRFKLLVHTDYLAQHYASTFVGQLPIERIYYGVETDVFRPLERGAAAEALKLPLQNRFTVALLHSYVTDKRKGLLPLLVPLQALAERMPGRLAVLVVGRDSERAREYATEQLPITTIPFLASQEQLAMALNLCDVLLYPTRADNLSLTCLNALACGLPVISSRVGGQPEAVIDGVNGFLCDMDDHAQMIERVGRLAADEALRQRLSLAARRTIIERFDINLYLTELIAYYERVLRDENHA